MCKVFFQMVFIMMIITISGCGMRDKEDDTPLTPTSNGTLASFQPKGTISGLIVNGVTNAPVPNAIISVGFDGTAKTTTTNSLGVFSFADVPAGQYRIVNGTTVLSGTYTLSVSLVSYNAAQTDPNKKYRDFYLPVVTITFTSLTLSDSVPVSGLVGSVVLPITYLNTTIKGTIVDQNYQPVPAASVVLYDVTAFPNIAIGQTVTGASGEYQFSNIDNALTVDISAKSADGSQQGSLTGVWTLPANVMSDSLRTQVTAERIRITPVDNSAPFVISISPEHLSDVPVSSAITVTFSEPVKQTPYTRTDLPLGRTTIMDDITLSYTGFKKAEANVSFSAQWQANNTKLVITPSALTGSAKYSFDMRTAANSGNLKDLASNALVNNTQITGDFELLTFSTAGNSTVPATPVLTRRFIPGLFTDLNFTGGNVGLQWNNDVNARSYNVYRSVNGGPYELLQKDLYTTQLSTPTGSLVTPSPANNPLSAIHVSYQVRAVSKDLVESAASNSITVEDAVKPQLQTATIAAGIGVNNWVYTLRFTEPMKIEQAETVGNYSFVNTTNVGYTVNKADYLGFSANVYIVQLNVTSDAVPVAGYVLVVGNTVVDLRGLTMDAQANSKAF